MRHRALKSRAARLMASVFAVALLATACSSDTDDGDEEPGAEEPTDDETGGDDDAGEDASAEPAEFVYGAAGVPDTLDIWTTYQGDPSRVQMYEWGSKLVWYDTDSVADSGCTQLPTTADVRPGLAESWEVDDDGNLVFTLREGVMSAAGNELTADDVVWSLDRAKEQSGVVQFLVGDVVDFAEENTYEALDDRTVRVNTNNPTALDVSVFTYPMFQVLDTTVVQENVTEDDPWATEWLTTNHADFGPWQLESFDPGQEATYTRNPNYWDADRLGNIERLVIRNVAESSTRLQLLSTGEADYAERLSFDEYAQLQSTEGVQVFNCLSPNRDTLMLNQAFEPFTDVDVRKAVSMAIDREALVQGVYQGFATPSTTGMAPIYWDPPEDADSITYDPEAAEQMLADAGVTDLSFEIMASPTRPGAHAESLALQIQSFLSDVGVDASVNIVPGSTEFSDAFFEGNYESVIYLEPPALGDPFYSANLYNTTVSFQNTFGYDNPTYDELVADLKATNPGEERDALIAQVSDLIVEDVPQVYLVERSYTQALSEAVTGFTNAAHGQLLTFQMSKG